MQHDPVLSKVISLLGRGLNLGPRVADLNANTPLLGSMPEFDSMAVVTILEMIEDDFGVSVDDDEISGDIFRTVGELAGFVKTKVGF